VRAMSVSMIVKLRKSPETQSLPDGNRVLR